MLGLQRQRLRGVSRTTLAFGSLSGMTNEVERGKHAKKTN